MMQRQPSLRDPVASLLDRRTLTTDRAASVTKVTVSAVARYFGGSHYRPDKVSVDRIQAAIAHAADLASPQAVYRLYRVKEVIAGNTITLANDVALKVPGCFAVSKTELIGVVLGTLGPLLEGRCRALAKGGEIYQSTLLDAIGTAMLDLLSDAVSSQIAGQCGTVDLVRGPRFAPGIDGYPLGAQRLLFSLVDYQAVGVALNSSSVMTPAKSVSFFQTMRYTSAEPSSTHKCAQCRMVDCQFRIPEKSIDIKE